jgi:hypothetical protein
MEGILLSTSNTIALDNENVLFRSDLATVNTREVTLLLEVDLDMNLLMQDTSEMVIASPPYSLLSIRMLSSAILGNVFASPSVHSILLAIRVAAGPHGVLLIVKNYTGDRLNFGIAAQRAKTEGLQVEMVLVDDDCALPKGKGITGRRGVAGTILVHKVAGAAARKGFSLIDVKKIAQKAIDNM